MNSKTKLFALSILTVGAVAGAVISSNALGDEPKFEMMRADLVTPPSSI